MSNPNPRKPELSSVFSLSKMSKASPFALERASLYIPLVKLTRQALQEGDPSIHVYGGEQKQYSYLKISAKADEQQSAGKKCHLGQKERRSATKSADRQQIVPAGKLYCRWQQKPAGGI